MTWKIVGVPEASVLYIYIYIYIDKSEVRDWEQGEK